MADFRRLSDSMFASPQITAGEVAEAAALGIALIVNNRPDGESPDQPDGAEIEAAARAHGMDYVAIPVTAAGFSGPQVEAMNAALSGSRGPVLAYCRSGTRSTLLWSLAEAAKGTDLDTIADRAAQAGYDVSPVRPAMEMLGGKAGG